MEFLQRDHRERKLKLAFAHTVSKLGSPVSSKVLVTVVLFVPKDNFIHERNLHRLLAVYEDHNALS